MRNPFGTCFPGCGDKLTNPKAYDRDPEELKEVDEDRVDAARQAAGAESAENTGQQYSSRQEGMRYGVTADVKTTGEQESANQQTNVPSPGETNGLQKKQQAVSRKELPTDTRDGPMMSGVLSDSVSAGYGATAEEQRREQVRDLPSPPQHELDGNVQNSPMAKEKARRVLES